MPLLLALKGRSFFLKDKKRLFTGVRIKKQHFFIAGALFLLASAESGHFARKHCPGYDHFARAEVTVLDVGQLQRFGGSVRLVLGAEDERREVRCGDRSDQESVVFHLRHALPQLRLLAFGKSHRLAREELLGYCQVPLELLENGRQYSGKLRLYHPISRSSTGDVEVQLKYTSDPEKTRLSYITPTSTLPAELQSVDESAQISASIDLMELLNLAQSIGGQLSEIGAQLNAWWGWQYPARSLFSGSLLVLVAIRPQYAGVWVNTVVSTAMIVSGLQKFYPEVHDRFRAFTAATGFDAKQSDFNFDLFKQSVLNAVDSRRRRQAQGETLLMPEETDGEAQNGGEDVQLSQQRWLLLRAAEYAGFLKPIGPLMLNLEAFLSTLRRIGLWEDVPKALAVTGGSILLGTTSAFVRLPKVRVTSWICGFASICVLSTAPWMASGGVLGGSLNYFGHRALGTGRFPKVDTLEKVNSIAPWDLKRNDPSAWSRELKQG